MAKIGYIRVSSADQNPVRQQDALSALGVEKTFIDKLSGSNVNRPGLTAMLEYVREGDILFFESISRLARNTRDFLSMMELFEKSGVSVISLKEPIDTTTPAGKLIYTIFAAVAEMERDYIKARQREGQYAAKTRGQQTGRPPIPYPSGWNEAINRWKSGEMTAVETMKLLKLSKSTFYQLVRKQNKGG